MNAGPGGRRPGMRYRRRGAVSGPARYAAAAPGPAIAGGTATARAGTAAAAVALAAARGLAAACWVVAVRQMTGMDMGTATRPGSFGFFITVWAAMMAAMMLPGAAPAVARAARAAGVPAVPVFAGSCLAVWALAGVVVYAVDRPHGSVAAGVVVIAAGVYEVTPLKRHCRRRCREGIGSGLGRLTFVESPLIAISSCGRRWSHLCPIPEQSRGTACP